MKKKDFKDMFETYDFIQCRSCIKIEDDDQEYYVNILRYLKFRINNHSRLEISRRYFESRGNWSATYVLERCDALIQEKKVKGRSKATVYDFKLLGFYVFGYEDYFLVLLSNDELRNKYFSEIYEYCNNLKTKKENNKNEI